MELLKQARQEDPDTAVIIVSSVSVVHDDKTFGVVDMKTVIECLKLGAHAVLWKPVFYDELLITAKRALERRQLLIERRQRPDRLARPNAQGGA